MKLFWKEFFGGRRYWGSVIFPASLALAIIDFVRPDLYFGRNYFKGWLLFWGVALAYHYIRLILDPPILKWNDWLEKMREKQIRGIVDKNPEYQTLCHHCKRYNQKKMICIRLQKNKRVKWIKINNYDQKDYCLYWRLF